MSNFNIIKVGSANQSGKNSFDLSMSHQTTLEFGQILPLANWDCIASDSFNVNLSQFSRCAPLVLPTYGDIQLKTMSVFVPYHQVAEDFDAFISGKKMYKGVPTRMRYLTFEDLFSFLESYSEPSIDTEGFDFASADSEGIVVRRKFTAKGKYFYKVLRSLGYQLPTCFQYGSEVSYKQLNALPIICFVKAVNDYMSQAASYDNSPVTSLLKRIADGSVYHIDFTVLSTLLSGVNLMYQPDYFTTAWSSPSAPIHNADIYFPSSFLAGWSQGAGGINIDTDGGPILFAKPFAEGASIPLYANDLETLRAFDAWHRRNSYSGSRTIEMILSRYGIKVSDYNVEYSDLINSSSTRLQVGDVTSTASSLTAELGDYAGKGIASGNTSFSYRCSDFGQLIVIGYITVKPIYADGFDRQCLKVNPLEFYQPEYDGVGINAISRYEVATNPRSTTPYDGDVVFGYTERYNEYRCGKDKVTGDMSLPRYIDSEKWHLNRDLTALISSNKLTAQNPAFMTFFGTEYNKIFQGLIDGEEDHFYLTFNFDVKAIRPIKSVDSSAKLGDGNITIHRNGNIVA